MGWDAVRRAAEDRASGAAEITRRAAEALAALPRSALDDAVETLVRGHPSMAPLWRLGSEALSAADHRDAAAGFARRLSEERDAVAGSVRPLLAAAKSIVTHSSSSTLAAALAGTRVPVRCGRSQPGGEGAAMAARLQASGVDAEVVEDDEAVGLSETGATVLTGADAVGPGGVVNKVGTATLAGAAIGRCFALAGGSKLIRADLPAPHPFERIALDRITVVGVSGPLEEGALRAELGRAALHPALEEVLQALRTAPS